MRYRRALMPLAVVALIGGVAAAGYVTRGRWLPLLERSTDKTAGPREAPGEPPAPTGKVIVNEQAQRNLGLTARPLQPRTYWKSIPVPGMVVDRPGVSDRGVVAPAAGVVARIHRVPGEAVRPGDPLFTLKLLGESLHQTQTELFKATQEIALVRAERKRLVALAETVAGVEVIKVDQQITRLQVAVMHPKPGLIGLSRGGLYCMNWAAAHPDKTLAVYLDNAVCDFKSWPGGARLKLGTSKAGSEAEWKKLLAAYEFTNNEEAIAYKSNPVDNLTPLAKAKIPLLLVYGDKDTVVPHVENSELVYDRYKALGGPVERVVKTGQDHHPHGLKDVTPVVKFFTGAHESKK